MLFFVVLWFFFQNQLFGKILSGVTSECQTDRIQISPDILSGLIWVQSSCCEQTTLSRQYVITLACWESVNLFSKINSVDGTISVKQFCLTWSGSCTDPERWTGVQDPPLKNHKNIGFLSNTGPDPLKNHKATKPAFNFRPSLAHQQNAI